MIGVVKWFGKLPDVDGKMVGIECPERIPKALLEKFVQEAKGGENADGTYGGKKYFDGKEQRSIFISVNKMKKVIQGETLLSQMKTLTKEIKAQHAEISALKDQINLAGKDVPANFGSNPAEVKPDDSSDKSINSFLEREIKK